MTKLVSQPSAVPSGSQTQSIPRGSRTDRISQDRLESVLQKIAGMIAPVWPLSDYVAVNPFLGFADHDWLQTRALLRGIADVETLMPLSYYRNKFQRQELKIEDIEAAIDEFLRDGVAGADALDAERIADKLKSDATAEGDPDALHDQAPALEPLTAVVDRYAQTDWSRFAVDEIGKVCSAHYDEGHAAWRSPWRRLSLYQAWRSAAQYDRSAEISGLPDFRRFVARLPHAPEAAIAVLLERLGVPRDLWERFLLCQAFTVLGWASRAKYQAVQAERCGEDSDDLLGVMAMRLAYDVAVSECHGITVDWSTPRRHGDSASQREILLRNCLLRASEIAYRKSLLSKLADVRTGSREPQSATSKLARFVFCIDVRSERLRRALESCSHEIETSGFAGFFGIPMSYLRWGESHPHSHVPAPLTPRFQVQEGLPEADDPEPVAESIMRRRRFIRRMRQGWRTFQSSAIGGLGFVETAAWWTGFKMAARTLVVGGNPCDGRFDGLDASHGNSLGPQLASWDGQGVTLAEQIDLAQTVLKNLGLTSDFPRFVLLCGHASETTNNPLQAGLDCGACCGHSGEASARFAAALLNKPSVRQGLAARGIAVPDETHFIAAVHNTVTDELDFFDIGGLPASHARDLPSLRTLGRIAAVKTRRERMADLGAGDDADLLRRARDWSEVQPEWGLAGNAAMIVGPRALTRGASFGGRTFLHDYDFRCDEDGSVLELILTAPLVVAHWINMQYYASVVDNPRWGSGPKPVHNVVGRFGLLAGGGGDLLTGLPLQSLSNGESWQHEPLRLQAVVAAPRSAIDRIVNKHAALRDLIANGWLHLVADEEGRFFRLTRRLGWLPLHVEHGAADEAAAETNAVDYVTHPGK